MRGLRAIVLAVAALAGAAGAPAAEARSDLVLAVRGEPRHGFDPLRGWGAYGNPLFQSTLLRRTQDLSVEGDLATAWTLSPDRLSWTIDIRADARFSDGTPVAARDVAFTFTQAKRAGSTVDLTVMESAEAAGPHRVVIRLAEPRITFRDLFVTLGIVPAHAYGPGYGRNPIGSGPFRLVAWSEGQQAIVEPNPFHHGRRPAFARVTFLFTGDDASFAAAQAGRVHLAAIPNGLAGRVPRGMRLVSAQSVDNRGLMFPMRRATGERTAAGAAIGNDVTSDLAIRRAINLAIDRNALVAGVLDGRGRPAYGPADGMPWDNLDAHVEDGGPAIARRVLAEAGWTPGPGGILQRDGVRAEITLLFPATDQLRQALALAVADMVRPLGIRITPSGRTWDDIRRLAHSNAVLFGWGDHSPAEMFALHYGPNGGAGFTNPGFYANPAVDVALLAAQRAESFEASLPHWRAAMWNGTTGFGMRGDAAWAWLVNVDHTYFVADCLDIGPRQIHPHGHGFPVTWNIADWRWTCP